ncbi:MAG: hypothetical protein DMG02_26930 [Acidobacteria bacterium]|nr:MAG: hypothetical protein DMG02_26930 [Acidobacteriota bacterium]
MRRCSITSVMPFAVSTSYDGYGIGPVSECGSSVSGSFPRKVATISLRVLPCWVRSVTIAVLADPTSGP